MKYFKFYIVLIILLSCSPVSKNTTSIKSLDLTNEIIGVWEFLEMTDKQGNKLDSYKTGFGTVTATGPKLIYNKNKTYIKVFTPNNSDKGYWRFNPQLSTIEHDLFIDSTDFIGKDLIKNKLAIKKPDGNYYELIEDKILKFEKNQLFIDHRGLINVYQRVK